jgi:hypothetical protein
MRALFPMFNLFLAMMAIAIGTGGELLPDPKEAIELTQVVGYQICSDLNLFMIGLLWMVASATGFIQKNNLFFLAGLIATSIFGVMAIQCFNALYGDNVLWALSGVYITMNAVTAFVTPFYEEKWEDSMESFFKKLWNKELFSKDVEGEVDDEVLEVLMKNFKQLGWHLKVRTLMVVDFEGRGGKDWYHSDTYPGEDVKVPYHRVSFWSADGRACSYHTNEVRRPSIKELHSFVRKNRKTAILIAELTETNREKHVIKTA